jgi:hypothetical protein
VFLTSALFGGEWLASRPGLFTPGERALGTHWMGGSMCSRTGLNDVDRKILPLPGLELCPLDRPARSQSLYRLENQCLVPGIESLPFVTLSLAVVTAVRAANGAGALKDVY